MFEELGIYSYHCTPDNYYKNNYFELLNNGGKLVTPGLLWEFISEYSIRLYDTDPKTAQQIMDELDAIENLVNEAAYSEEWLSQFRQANPDSSDAQTCDSEREKLKEELAKLIPIEKLGFPPEVNFTLADMLTIRLFFNKVWLHLPKATYDPKNTFLS